MIHNRFWKSPSWQPAPFAPMGASWRLLDWPRRGLSPRPPPPLIQISLAANGRAVQWEGGHLAPTRGSIYECGLAGRGKGIQRVPGGTRDDLSGRETVPP